MKTIACFFAALTLAAAAFAADIAMQTVDSSFIDQVGYDAASETLAVKMHNSSDTYYYEDVPSSVHAEFLAAPSKGRYFVDNIKDQYSTRLEP